MSLSLQASWPVDAAVQAVDSSEISVELRNLIARRLTSAHSGNHCSLECLPEVREMVM